MSAVKICSIVINVFGFRKVCPYRFSTI